MQNAFQAPIMKQSIVEIKKLNDQKHPSLFESMSILPKLEKRSYHRAVKRAAQHGITTYRGRQHTLRTLGANRQAQDEHSQRPTPSQLHHCSKPNASQRCRIVTWNSPFYVRTTRPTVGNYRDLKAPTGY